MSSIGKAVALTTTTPSGIVIAPSSVPDLGVGFGAARVEFDITSRGIDVDITGGTTNITGAPMSNLDMGSIPSVRDIPAPRIYLVGFAGENDLPPSIHRDIAKMISDGGSTPVADHRIGIRSIGGHELDPPCRIDHDVSVVTKRTVRDTSNDSLHGMRCGIRIGAPDPVDRNSVSGVAGVSDRSVPGAGVDCRGAIGIGIHEGQCRVIGAGDIS